MFNVSDFINGKITRDDNQEIHDISVSHISVKCEQQNRKSSQKRAVSNEVSLQRE